MGNWLWALDTEHYRLCVGDGDEYHLSNKHALVAGTDRDGVGGDETSVYTARAREVLFERTQTRRSISPRRSGRREIASSENPSIRPHAGTNMMTRTMPSTSLFSTQDSTRHAQNYNGSQQLARHPAPHQPIRLCH